MRLRRFSLVLLTASLLLAGLPSLSADETLKPGARIDSLTVGKTTYTQVQVRSFNVHTLMITHSGGMASIHLRDLAPEWQARFNYSSAAEAAAELAERDAPPPVPVKRPARAAMKKSLAGFDLLLEQFGQPATLQPEVNLRTKFTELGMGVRDQGRRPSCAIYAIVTALEFECAELTGQAQNFSEDYLIWATQKTIRRIPAHPGGPGETAPEDADAGFSLTEVVTALRAYGIPLQSSMPNNFDKRMEAIPEPSPEIIREARTHQKVFVHPLPGRDGATRINNLIHALNAGIPVAVGLAWPNYHSLRTGFLDAQIPMQNAWHAVTIVGYHSKGARIEDTYFIFKNSWGGYWGQGGYGTVTYSYLNNYLNEAALLEVQSG